MEVRVQQLGSKLANSIEQPKAKELMVKFVAAHEAMRASYRKGL